MAITKKELDKLAAAMKEAYDETPRSAEIGVSMVIENLTKALETINPAFQKDRFLRACDYRQFP